MFGTTYSDLENAGVMLPLVNLTCHFIQPALYEDELIVRTWCIHMTAARIEFSYSVRRKESDGKEVELCYGTTEHGFIDSKTFRPCNAKKRLPELYAKLNGNIKEI